MCCFVFKNSFNLFLEIFDFKVFCRTFPTFSLVTCIFRDPQVLRPDVKIVRINHTKAMLFPGPSYDHHTIPN